MEVLRGFLEDPDAQWSAGTFGAIAEFSRDRDEPVTFDFRDTSASVATARGAIALRDCAAVRFSAYETVARDRASWRHGVALCLPAVASWMNQRTVVTELGPDVNAVRPQDRHAILFDLGLSLAQTDAAVRTSDRTLIAALRRSEGRPLFDADNPVLMDILLGSPHRVFLTRLGRVEVFQPIPPPAGKSPPGPHTHILPKLLRANRTHAATVPIPAGLVPCAMLYPAHPLLDGEGLPQAFDSDRFDAFNALLREYGTPALVAAADATLDAVRRGAPPEAMTLSASKFARTAVRVALRKLKASGETSPHLDAWLTRFDRPSAEDGADEEQHAC
ncbi:MAG: hypothetical protein EKK41_02285 [Hyphomicrobiales bacterium]|nr:MAG: hypothetical protein EKK41_02285 [Hyphomicrobiales bacterium]